MTPLHLSILLHYYGSMAPYGNPSAVADEYTDWLCREGLIIPTKEAYVASPRGCFFIEALLKTPLPVQQWVIPERVIE